MTGIFLNFYSFGISAVLIFTFLLSLYIYNLDNRLSGTVHLGTGFFFLSLFTSGYLWAAIDIRPVSAYHRYITLSSVFPAIIHFGQWVLHYPQNKSVKTGKVIFFTGYLIALAAVVWFVHETFYAQKIFNLTGHNWDLQSDRESKWMAVLILLYSFIHFIFLPVWKSGAVSGKYKSVIYKMSLGMLIASLVPNLTNVLSRDGSIQREWYLLSLVIMFVPGFFYIALVYIQNSSETSSLAAKITGITLVTFILVIQWTSLYINQKTGNDLHEYCKSAGRVGTAANLKPATEDLVFVSTGDPLPVGQCVIDIKQGMLKSIDYTVYREKIHKIYFNLHILLLLVVVFILTVFHAVIKSTVIKPVEYLVKTINSVKQGTRNIRAPVLVMDEIGYLSETFNSMLDTLTEAEKEIQIYAAGLEDKVNERTVEITKNLEEINLLKIQQDGDYYLTSLLLKPLICNRNHSQIVKTEIFLKQKKQVVFRNKTSELGGDFCLTETLSFIESGKEEKYVFAVNADAMGKSMQGAGGALVLAVLIHSVLEKKPEVKNEDEPFKLLEKIWEEINGTFSAFNGTMTVSCLVVMIKESTGELFYINSEHPAPVLLRNQQASITMEDRITRKMGYENDGILINYMKLNHGDDLFLASDGRDDILIRDDLGKEEMNFDENLFPQIVEAAGGDINAILTGLEQKGKLVDDFSVVKISYFPVKDHNNPLKTVSGQILEKSYYLSNRKYGTEEGMQKTGIG